MYIYICVCVCVYVVLRKLDLYIFQIKIRKSLFNASSVLFYVLSLKMVMMPSFVRTYEKFKRIKCLI